MHVPTRLPLPDRLCACPVHGGTLSDLFASAASAKLADPQRVLEDVFPNLLTDAPVERRITRNVIQFLNAGSAVAVD